MGQIIRGLAVHLVGKKVEVRYDRSKNDRYIVYFRDKRMGEATLIDLHANANGIRKRFDKDSNKRHPSK